MVIENIFYISQKQCIIEIDDWSSEDNLKNQYLADVVKVGEDSLSFTIMK